MAFLWIFVMFVSGMVAIAFAIYAIKLFKADIKHAYQVDSGRGLKSDGTPQRQTKPVITL